jgi:thiamine-phosphate diphosphorylase
MGLSIDLRVYVLTEEVPELGRTRLDVAREAAKGGATAIQYRNKTGSPAERLWEALAIESICEKTGVILIINDFPDAAAIIGAEGVHVGSSDCSLDEARKILPTEAIVGVSATNYAEAVAADKAGADYIGVGPVFPTESKPDAAPAVGIEEFGRICRAVKAPVVAIGGIDADNLEAVARAGAAGAAVIAAVARAKDMTEATSRLRQAWEKLGERKI